jgi:putative flippase GtrA
LNGKRLIKFLIVGALGVGINYAIYFPTKDLVTWNFVFMAFKFHVDFMWLAGICISAISNYILNEFWTFNEAGQVQPNPLNSE